LSTLFTLKSMRKEIKSFIWASRSYFTMLQNTEGFLLKSRRTINFIDWISFKQIVLWFIQIRSDYRIVLITVT